MRTCAAGLSTTVLQTRSTTTLRPTTLPTSLRSTRLRTTRLRTTSLRAALWSTGLGSACLRTTGTLRRSSPLSRSGTLLRWRTLLRSAALPRSALRRAAVRRRRLPRAHRPRTGLAGTGLGRAGLGGTRLAGTGVAGTGLGRTGLVGVRLLAWLSGAGLPAGLGGAGLGGTGLGGAGLVGWAGLVWVGLPGRVLVGGFRTPVGPAFAEPLVRRPLLLGRTRVLELAFGVLGLAPPRGRLAIPGRRLRRTGRLVAVSRFAPRGWIPVVRHRYSSRPSGCSRQRGASGVVRGADAAPGPASPRTNCSPPDILCVIRAHQASQPGQSPSATRCTVIETTMTW